MIAYLSLALWTIVVALYSPSALTYISGKFSPLRAYKTGIFFGALCWTGGLGRLVFFPNAESLRSVVLLFSCAAAFYLCLIKVQERRQ